MKRIRLVYSEGKAITADIRKATGSDAPAASCSAFTDELIRVVSTLA